MQQRLAIGRAIIHDPEVLLLDEPHTGLDQDACEMLDTVLRQVAARQRTVVMTSHDRLGLPQDGLLAFYREALNAASNVPGGAA